MEETNVEFSEILNVMDHMQIGLMIYKLDNLSDDRTLILIDINDKASAIIGIEPETLINRTMDENFPALREQGLPKIYADVVRNQSSKDLGEVVYGDDRIKKSVFEVKAFPLHGKYFGAAFTDITKQKQREIEIQRVSRRLALSIENMPNAYIHWDTDLRVIEWNREAEKIFGYSKEEMLGKHAADYIVPEEAREIVGQVLGKLKVGKVADYSEKDNNIHKNGTKISVEWHNTPIADDDGKILGILSLAKDISERQEAQEELEKFFDLVPDMVCIASSDGYFKKLNNAWTKTLGYSKEELLSEPLASFIHPEDVEITFKETEIQLAGGTTASFTNRYRCKDNSYKVFEWVAAPAAGDKLYATARDITKQKLIGEKLRQAEKMEAVGHLAGGIAHDFNNLLGAIIGFSELIIEELPSDSLAAEFTGQILSASDRAKRLVQQILTFSRQTKDNTEPLFLKPIIKEVTQLLRATVPSSVVMKLNFDNESRTVLADQTKIHEIVMNLCTNAVHSMNDKGVLEISLCEIKDTDSVEGLLGSSARGDYTVITVTDSGGGIDNNTLEHMFEPYFTTKAVGQGTGMGLAVIIGIIQSYDGNITVKTKLNEGSSFAVYLPQRGGEQSTDTTDSVIPHGGSESILFVDDEQLLCDMANAMLKKLGYRVTTCSDSTSALEIFRNSPDSFDLIITDQTMPGLTGLELSKEIQIIQKEIPIIISTGFSKTLDENIAIKSGLSGFIAKPIRMLQLDRKIKSILHPDSKQTLR